MQLYTVKLINIYTKYTKPILICHKHKQNAIRCSYEKLNINITFCLNKRGIIIPSFHKHIILAFLCSPTKNNSI